MLLDPIDIKTAALLVIDMQNGFLEPGAPVETPVAREIVGNINAISAAMRAAGSQNIFLRFATSPDAPRSAATTPERTCCTTRCARFWAST